MEKKGGRLAGGGAGKRNPEDLVKLKEKLDQGAGEIELPVEADTVTLSQLEQKLADAETELKAATRHLSEAESEQNGAAASCHNWWRPRNSG